MPVLRGSVPRKALYFFTDTSHTWHPFSCKPRTGRGRGREACPDGWVAWCSRKAQVPPFRAVWLFSFPAPVSSSTIKMGLRTLSTCQSRAWGKECLGKGHLCDHCQRRQEWKDVSLNRWFWEEPEKLSLPRMSGIHSIRLGGWAVGCLGIPLFPTTAQGTGSRWCRERALSQRTKAHCVLGKVRASICLWLL